MDWQRDACERVLRRNRSTHTNAAQSWLDEVIIEVRPLFFRSHSQIATRSPNLISLQYPHSGAASSTSTRTHFYIYTLCTHPSNSSALSLSTPLS